MSTAAAGGPDVVTASASASASEPAPSWRGRLVTVAAVYVFSRLCVLVGAAVVATEVRADEHLRNAEYPWDEIADPHYPGWNLPTRAGRVILDVLTAWDGNWYLQIARNGYPHTVAG